MGRRGLGEVTEIHGGGMMWCRWEYQEIKMSTRRFVGFAVVIDVVTELAREGLLSELLYADDLVLMSESIEEVKGF